MVATYNFGSVYSVLLVVTRTGIFHFRIPYMDLLRKDIIMYNGSSIVSNKYNLVETFCVFTKLETIQAFH